MTGNWNQLSRENTVNCHRFRHVRSGFYLVDRHVFNYKAFFIKLKCLTSSAFTNFSVIGDMNLVFPEH